GDWPGQHSGWLFVPERDFALTVLTNSTGGARLTTDLFYDDWTLQRFAGLRNPPAVPTPLPAARLAEYEGTYVGRGINVAGEWEEAVISTTASDGALQAAFEAQGHILDQRFEFYRGEYVLVVSDETGPPGGVRGNFVRGPDGRVAWFSFGGRLYAHQV